MLDYNYIYHHGYLLCSLWLHKQNEKGRNISFHRFPHNKPNLLQKWVQAVRRQIGIQTRIVSFAVSTLLSLVLL